ncbi:MAG: heavy metal translocating P-type ATPase [Elusimicrobiota bacterium]
MAKNLKAARLGGINSLTAFFCAAAIAAHFALAVLLPGRVFAQAVPLYIAAAIGGVPIAFKIASRLLARSAGTDVLALISLLAAAAMGQWLVAAILILMVSGGQALEDYAVRKASSVLEALARRMPQKAHKKSAAGFSDIGIEDVSSGDVLVIMPHEICPVDGVVTQGHGRMDESYLTGEPYEMAKTPGSQTLSGAVNGETTLVIRALRPAKDSRHARIMKVMEEAEAKKPRIRRLAETLGFWYAPLALALAAGAWILSRESSRFLAVLVIATPCPLLIAIPVAILGAISLAAKNGIVIKNPAALERLMRCRTVIFDKTGTLTYGRPILSRVRCAKEFPRAPALELAASLEQYSKHPLAAAIISAAQSAGVSPRDASEVLEKPGQGISGIIDGFRVKLTGRVQALREGLAAPPPESGLECLLLVDGALAAVFSFRDEPRSESRSFLDHLKPFHRVDKVMMVSGDRESEVRYLAEVLGIETVMAEKTPEEKVAIVLEETAKAETLFVGDGTNDAPALKAATVGVAFGPESDVASDAADAVIMTSSLGKVDELIHISSRMRAIALQSAIGGMALSLVGMFFAATGRLPPIQGAAGQEIIDLLAVLNAVRAAWPPSRLTDF